MRPPDTAVAAADGSDGAGGAGEATLVALQRKALRVVIVSQVLGGAGLAAGVTVGALLAQQMLGSTGLAGLPAALFTGGSAAAALAVGRLSDRFGRRTGLALGYAAGAIGGAGVVLAAATGNVVLLLVAFTVYGAGTATNLQARYAGADLAAPAARGRAVSTVLVATTVGAVAGPNLIDITGALAQRVGVPALAGPFALAAAAYALAGAVLLALLRPDPLLTARRLGLGIGTAAQAPELPGLSELPDPPTPRGHSAQSAQPTSDVVTAQARTRRTLIIAATAMVLTQLVMVAIMTMTPIQLRGNGHGLGAVGIVIAVHVASMYLPSPLTGWMADRYGRQPVLVAAGGVLLAAGVVGALAPPASLVALAAALGLLGLGWNLGLIGGTALVTDATPGEGRARVQGTIDVAVALSGAAGGIASGAVVAGMGYPALALAGGVLALLIIPITLLRAGEWRGPGELNGTAPGSGRRA